MKAKEYFRNKQMEESADVQGQVKRKTEAVKKDTGGELIELSVRINKHKQNKRRLIIAVLALAAAAVFGFWFILSRQSYTEYKVLSKVDRTDDTDGSYIHFGNELIRYTNDGITATDSELKELWQQAYEMNSPTVVQCGGSIAVADKGGNKIYVFSSDGLKGNIATEMPIQSISVSNQGVTAAILRNGEQTKIICYDLKGTKLVEAKASLGGNGYPVAASISEDGQRLLVSYVSIGDTITSKLVCYSFSSNGLTQETMKVLEEEFSGTIIPTVFFADNDTAVAAAGDRLVIYKGSDKPSKSSEISYDRQIKSILHSGNDIAVILKNTEGEDKYTLKVYNLNGRELSSAGFNDDYTAIHMENNRIIMLNDLKCCIYSTGGRKIFTGEFDTSLSAVIPLSGINKYLVVRSDQLQTIRLIK